MKKLLAILLSIIITSIFASADIPDIPDKYIIFEKANSGYDLYIKKMNGIDSILLTESQKDPELQKTNYGLRTPQFHPCNGDEKRILDGKVLSTQYDIFFLVDSTTENHSQLGEAFHYFLPEKVFFGYEWTRNGELKIMPGTRINLRKFEKKYTDYTGAFEDQWIILKLNYHKRKFQPDLIENFKELSSNTNGTTLIKTDKHNLKQIFSNFIPERIPVSYEAEVIFILDTTISMKEEMPLFKQEFKNMINTILKKVRYLRLGLVLYRDYGESFLTQTHGLSNDLKYMENLIYQIKINGGDDIPEAVNEAIGELDKFDYRSKTRIAFLLGDAPAHPRPRGKITREEALQILKDQQIVLHSICLPTR